MTPQPIPNIITHRNQHQDAAILFIHGFNGNAAATWGRFPEFLEENRNLKSWDIYNLAYSSKLQIDIMGIWEADPDIPILARYLDNVCTYGIFSRYSSIAIIAHSMGGLVVQRALVDFEALRDKTSHLFMFGTPSAGLRKASLFRFLKPQIRNLSKNSDFIKDLRSRWRQNFSTALGKRLTFHLWCIAGDRDQFVPAKSSLQPFKNGFPDARLAVVPGNHLQIVTPQDKNNLSVELVVNGICHSSGILGEWNSAAVAVESRDFHKAINILEPHAEELDEDALVQLALAYESLGRSHDAFAVFQKRKLSTTDAMGVLAGRLKRRWLVERRSQDAMRARELYATALEKSLKSLDYEQAYYHGINVAFMDLAYAPNRTDAKKRASTMAKRILGYCEKAPQDKWRYATEAEAWLMLNDLEKSIDLYRRYLAEGPSPRERESTFQQAKKVADLMGFRYNSVTSEIDTIFLQEK